MKYIAVVGGSSCNRAEETLSYDVGVLTALRDGVVICGGGKGVMEAVSRGARENGGIVIGILPGKDRLEGNQYLSYSIPTGIGEARNALITRAADVVIAVGGEYGTLSEIGLALKMGKPVIGLNSWKIEPPREIKGGIIQAKNAEEAISLAFDLS